MMIFSLLLILVLNLIYIGEHFTTFQFADSEILLVKKYGILKNFCSREVNFFDYRPFLHLALHIQYLLFSNNPLLYHIVNFILHIFNSFLLFLFLRGIGSKQKINLFSLTLLINLSSAEALYMTKSIATLSTFFLLLSILLKRNISVFIFSLMAYTTREDTYYLPLWFFLLNEKRKMLVSFVSLILVNLAKVLCGIQVIPRPFSIDLSQIFIIFYPNLSTILGIVFGYFGFGWKFILITAISLSHIFSILFSPRALYTFYFLLSIGFASGMQKLLDKNKMIYKRVIVYLILITIISAIISALAVRKYMGNMNKNLKEYKKALYGMGEVKFKDKVCFIPDYKKKVNLNESKEIMKILMYQDMGDTAELLYGKKLKSYSKIVVALNSEIKGCKNFYGFHPEEGRWEKLNEKSLIELKNELRNVIIVEAKCRYSYSKQILKVECEEGEPPIPLIEVEGVFLPAFHIFHKMKPRGYEIFNPPPIFSTPYLISSGKWINLNENPEGEIH